MISCWPWIILLWYLGILYWFWSSLVWLWNQDLLLHLTEIYTKHKGGRECKLQHVHIAIIMDIQSMYMNFLEVLTHSIIIACIQERCSCHLHKSWPKTPDQSLMNWMLLAEFAIKLIKMIDSEVALCILWSRLFQSRFAFAVRQTPRPMKVQNCKGRVWKLCIYLCALTVQKHRDMHELCRWITLSIICKIVMCHIYSLALS
jgi:hypothetical protein